MKNGFVLVVLFFCVVDINAADRGSIFVGSLPSLQNSVDWNSGNRQLSYSDIVKKSKLKEEWKMAGGHLEESVASVGGGMCKVATFS